MTSTQRYLANNRNALLNASIAASSVATIESAVLERPLARKGSARVAMSGAYTGHEEALYEIEITDNTVITPLISQPIFSGAGTGAISGISFTGTAQTFSVKLADLGQVLTAAGTDMEGVSIVARTPGAAGNLIHLSIDLSGLIYTATNFSTIKPITAGSEALLGPEYDWDTKVMGADQQIPADAHRLVFGEDTSVVYRQYKVYKDAAWNYYFEPQLRRDIAQGTPIRFVSGSRTATLTDGVTTEVFPGIVTLYDLLSALQTGSALVQVDGVVANDRAPNGMAARDLTTRTDAHLMPSTGSGSAFAKAFEGTYVGANASTELISARCWAVSSKENLNAGIGREIWSLTGSVSGDLGNLQTAIPYEEPSGKFGLTIPLKTPDGFGQPRGRFGVAGIQYAARDAGIEPPPICVASLALGPEASDQSITLKYKKRPSGLCDCSSMSAPDLSGRFCLTGQTGGLTTMGYSPATLTRLTDMYDWGADTVRANSLYENGTAKPEPFIADLLPALRDFEANLAAVEGNAAAEENWDTVLAEFRLDVETNLGGGVGLVTIPGYTIPGGTVNHPAIPAIAGTDLIRVQIAGEDLAAGDFVFSFNGTWRKSLFGMGYNYGFVLESAVAGASVGAYVHDSINNALIGLVPGEYYFVDPTIPGKVTTLANGGYLDNPMGRALSTTELLFTSNGPTTLPVAEVPAWDEVIPDTVVPAKTISAPDILGMSIIKDRYKSRMDWVLITAGISPSGKLDAGTVAGGDGCWRDTGDAYYWEVVGGNGKYANAFSNTPYFSSREVPGIPGATRSTREFAFQINVKCTDSLKVDDQVTLSIGDAGWPSTYQVGDTLYLPIIAAQDLYLAGGQDGDNIQTWHVDGSVDGAFAPYLLDLDVPLPYSASGLAFSIAPGGIPFEAGDLYQFAVEGGHYKWRKDGGTWSAPGEITSAPLPLSDGLSAAFATGAAPSFAAGDLYRFRALQPAALSNVISPDVEAWRWIGSAATLTANLGGSQQIDCASIAFHTIPPGAIITLAGGMDGITWDWLEPITWRAGVMAHLFVEKTASWLKLEIIGATGGTIGWAWAGQALATDMSAECQLRRDYAVERSAGINPSAAFLGATRSGEIEWQQGILTDSDLPGLMAMLDHLKTNDDEPMIIIPQATRPEEAYPVRVLLDEIDLPEDGGYQPNSGNERRYGMKISVKGVVA